MKKVKKAKLVKRTSPPAKKSTKHVVPPPSVVELAIAKKLAAQAKKLKKQAAVVAAADAAPPAKRGKPVPIREVTCSECGDSFKSTNPNPSTCNKCGAKEAKKVRDDDAPHIDCRMMINGVGYPVDPSSLERTIGAGEWGHGRGLVDQWPEAAWVGLLTYLGLPADPLDPDVAGQPVKRLVQRVWYEAVKGEVPSRDTFAKRDEERQEEYLEKFEGVKVAVVEKKVRAQKAFANRPKLETKQIKVLNKKHGAREGTKRQIGLDIILASKSTDEASQKLLKAGCNNSFITFAVAQGFIELV